MAIRAPWKGWIRVAMPVISALILANTIGILTLAIFNAAALELSYANPPTYVTSHGSLARAQLVFFWCTIPTVLVTVTCTEIFSLWTDRLSPLWALISSSATICVWVLQLVLWQLCVQPIGSEAPGFCPYVYQGNGWGRFPSWYNATSKAPAQAVPTIFVLYLAQLAFAAKVFHRQRRCAFRRSDMSQTWLRKFDDEEVSSSEATTSQRTIIHSSSAVTSSWPSPFHASEYREMLSAGPQRPPASPVPKSVSPISLQPSEFGIVSPTTPKKGVETRPGSPFSFDEASEEAEERLSTGSLRPSPPSSVVIPPIRAMRPGRSLDELGHGRY